MVTRKERLANLVKLVFFAVLGGFLIQRVAAHFAEGDWTLAILVAVVAIVAIVAAVSALYNARPARWR